MYHIITNPSSRSGAGHTVLVTLKKRLQEKNIGYRVYYTEYPIHARQLSETIEAALSSGEEAVIVVLGGDGTINEVLSGIRDLSKCILGFIPVGSGNDLARGLGLPKNKEEIIERIVDGSVRRTIDIGCLRFEDRAGYSSLYGEDAPDEYHFAVSAGMGFDAAVCEETISSKIKAILNKVHLGQMCYSAIALKHLLRTKGTSLTIRTENGREYRFGEMLLACFMNGPFQGGGYPFAPDADPDDGLLQISVFDHVHFPKKVFSILMTRAGKSYQLPEVTHFQAACVSVEAGAPLWVHTDGEVAMRSGKITVGLMNGKLRLIV